MGKKENMRSYKYMRSRFVAYAIPVVFITSYLQDMIYVCNKSKDVRHCSIMERYVHNCLQFHHCWREQLMRVERWGWSDSPCLGAYQNPWRPSVAQLARPLSWGGKAVWLRETTDCLCSQLISFALWKSYSRFLLCILKQHWPSGWYGLQTVRTRHRQHSMWWIWHRSRIVLRNNRMLS